MSRLIAIESKKEAYSSDKNYCGYGMQEYPITKENIDALLNGMVLVDEDWDEYGALIYLVESEE